MNRPEDIAEAERQLTVRAAIEADRFGDPRLLGMMTADELDTIREDLAAKEDESARSEAGRRQFVSDENNNTYMDYPNNRAGRRRFAQDRKRGRV